jgi:hypothetical protein
MATTTRKVVTTEYVPPDEARPSARYSGDFWEIINGISTDEWADHLVRVYYANDRWESAGSPPGNKLTSKFDEEYIRDTWGGGRYLLILYGPPGGSKRVGQTFHVEIVGTPPKQFISGGGKPASEADSAGSQTVALEAMRMYANPEFVRMQMQMMVTAATEAMALIKSQMPAAQNPLETLRAAKEILGSGNHEGGLLDTLRVLKELGLVGSPEKKGIDEILGLITTLKTSGLINSGAQKADIAATFANNIPLLADRFVAGLEQLRLKSESDERTIRLQRGEIRQNDLNVITMDQQRQPPSTPAAGAPTPAAPAPAATVTPEVAQAIIAQAHLHRLVAGIKQPNSTGQDMYDYLVNAWPEILDELAKMSKETLLGFFKSREMQRTYFQCEILAEVGDDPRLPKMIEDFLRIAKQNEIPPAAAGSAPQTAI